MNPAFSPSLHPCFLPVQPLCLRVLVLNLKLDGLLNLMKMATHVPRIAARAFGIPEASADRHGCGS